MEQIRYDDYIKQYVDQMDVSRGYKKVLVEVLTRRAMQFDFTKEQVDKDISKLTKNIDSISVEPIGPRHITGYYTKERMLRVNSDRLKVLSEPEEKVEDYYNFTNGVYRALLMDENGRNLFDSQNRYLKVNNTALMETILERASRQTIYQSEDRDPYINRNSKDFPYLSFGIDMLCASYGVTEQELLSTAIQDGRKGLINLFSERTKIEPDKVDDLLDRFEANMTNIQNQLYGIFPAKSNKELGMNISVAMEGMTRTSLEVMQRSMMAVDYADFTPEKFENLKFNYNKLFNTIGEAGKPLQHIPGFSVYDVYNSTNEKMQNYKSAILQMDYVKRFDKQYGLPDEVKKYMVWARAGSLQNYDRFIAPTKDRFGLNNLASMGLRDLPTNVDADVLFRMSPEVIERNNTPHEKNQPWNNKIANSYYFANLGRLLGSKITSPIKKLFAPRKKALPAPTPRAKRQSSNVNGGRRQTMPEQKKASSRRMTEQEKNNIPRIEDDMLERIKVPRKTTRRTTPSKKASRDWVVNIPEVDKPRTSKGLDKKLPKIDDDFER